MAGFHIPWSDTDQWDQVGLSFSRVEDVHSKKCEKMSEVASDICEQYESISETVTRACSNTCPDCNDICCIRATIWFDFQDLLYLYFWKGRLPHTQIFKTALPGQRAACCHLSETGCSLARSERPFVCTWYFCPSQNAYLERFSKDGLKKIETSLIRIKGLRQELEDLFVRTAVSSV